MDYGSHQVPAPFNRGSKLLGGVLHHAKGLDRITLNRQCQKQCYTSGFKLVHGVDIESAGIKHIGKTEQHRSLPGSINMAVKNIKFTIFKAQLSHLL